MNDETRALRTTQANLISLQAARIAMLEARLDMANKTIEKLMAERKPVPLKASKGVQA